MDYSITSKFNTVFRNTFNYKCNDSHIGQWGHPEMYAAKPRKHLCMS